MGRNRPPKWLKAARLAGAPTDWIGRAFPRAGIMTPAETTFALAAGRVTRNGTVISEPSTSVTLEDVVTLDGARVDLRAPTIVLMFHKPAGLVVSGRDTEGPGTAFEALSARLPDELRHFGWHAIGRLDRATTGLLLFTNDERVVQHVTLPESALPKRYLATTESLVRQEHIDTLQAGVAIEDGPASARSARIRGAHELEIVIAEGRHHQVRRMLNAVRLAVIALHREAIGEVVLDVSEGDVRRLSENELREGLQFRASTESPSSSRRTLPE